MTARFKACLAAALALTLGSGFAKTVRVAPDGSGDGSSWGSPAALSAALSAAQAGDELWLKAGNYAVGENLSLGAAVSLRGGFAGTEAALANRAAAPGVSRLVASADSVTDILTFAHGSGEVLADYLAVSNCTGRGFLLNGAGDVTLDHCRSEGNGRSRYLAGRGASFTGDGQNVVTIRDCVFEGNLDRHSRESDLGKDYETRGLALYAANLRSLVLDRTRFFRNGIAPAAPGFAAPLADIAGRCDGQSVVFASNTVVTATGSDFVGNIVSGRNLHGGKIVFVTGRAGGSSFTGCRWVANDIHMGSSDIYARYNNGAWQRPTALKYSSASTCGSLVVDLAERTDAFALDGCTFAYNVTGSGWTAGLNVLSGAADITGSCFWGNVINATWGHEADLLVGYRATAAVNTTTFGTYGNGRFDATCERIALGDGMKYGDPAFATTPAAFIADCLTFQPAFVTLSAATFPFADTTRKEFEDTAPGKGAQAQVWIADGTYPDQVFSTPGKVAPLAAIDVTPSTTAGLGKTAIASTLAVASVAVTTPLDYKPKFVVMLGAGDPATVTCAYQFAPPANADDPAAYANRLTPGTFGPSQEFTLFGPVGGTRGDTLYYVVVTKNAKGAVATSGSVTVAGAEPTSWAAKTLNISPGEVPTMTSAHPAGWRSHYAWNDGDQRGSLTTGGRYRTWFRHMDDPAWGRDYDVTLGKDAGHVDDWFALQRPLDGEQEGRPLLVCLHGRGGGFQGFFATTAGVPDYGPYHCPTNFYALMLDCRENAMTDFWWGGMPPATPEAGMTRGSMQADYNNAYYSFIGGATLYGELNMGPSLDPFKWHKTSTLKWQLGHRGTVPAMKRVMDTIEWVVRKYKIDRNRIYLAGNSMGGQGTLGIGLVNGEVFAAINGNVPATIEYPAGQLGFVDESGKDVPAESFTAPAFDPPVMVDWSGSDDCWSRDHDILYRNMNRFRFQVAGWWGNYGHVGGYAQARATNDTLCLTFDYLDVVKNEAYPCFTYSDCNSEMPWPQQAWTAADATGGQIVDGKEAAAGTIIPREGCDLVGQWNGWYKWKVVEDSSACFKMKLWVASPEELPSETYKDRRPSRSIVDVSPRRLQNFRVDGTTRAQWTFEDGQAGLVEYDTRLRVATFRQLELTTTPRVLTLTKVVPNQAIVTGALVRAYSDRLDIVADVTSLGGASSAKLVAKWGLAPDAITGFQVLDASVTQTGAKRYTITGLDYNTPYCVRLEIDNGSGVTPYAFGYLKTDDIPRPPVCSLETMAMSLTATDLKLTISDLGHGSLWAKATVSVYADAERQRAVGSPVELTYDVPGLQVASFDGLVQDARYYVKVALRGENGETDERLFEFTQIEPEVFPDYGAGSKFLREISDNANRVYRSHAAQGVDGGDIILKLPGAEAGTYEYVHVFTNTATAASFSVAADLVDVRILCIGGGGGGGNSGRAFGTGGGGGGAGGYVLESAQTIGQGTYAVTVGAGGAAGASGTASSIVLSSEETPVCSALGGGGGGGNAGTGKDGGCGGGHGAKCATATAAVGSQGGNGGVSVNGNCGAGGGGAGANGESSSGKTDSYATAKGGAGLANDILGYEAWFAGGGAGSAYESAWAVAAGGKGGGGTGVKRDDYNDVQKRAVMRGENGRGGGGAAGTGSSSGASQSGGRGGDGIVIIRYLDQDPSGVRQAAVPVAREGLVYTGETQTGVEAKTGFTLAGDFFGCAVAEYTATATLKDGFEWADGYGDASRAVVWSIAKGRAAISGTLVLANWTEGDTPAEPSGLSSTLGTVVYVYYDDPACTAKRASAPTARGTYYVRGEVAGTENYDGAVSAAKAFSILKPDEPEPPVHVHSWIGPDVVFAPNCTTDGTNLWTCGGCDVVSNEVVAALGHHYVGGTCDRCGAREPEPAGDAEVTAAEGTFAKYWLGNELVLVFSNVAATSSFKLDGSATARILCVGGGGAGGCQSGNARAGGGGAGGLLETNDVALAAGVYTVQVGAGGASVKKVGSATDFAGNSGGDSEILFGGAVLVRAFGGGGGSGGDNPGLSGGSGGGGNYVSTAGGKGTPGQGFAGGGAADRQNSGSGGGGAGGAGSNGGYNRGGNGGAGRESDITGVRTYYAGGGAGASIAGTRGTGGMGGGGDGALNAWDSGRAGANGLGGGGGGACSGQGYSSGRGGNGVVVVRLTLAGGDEPGVDDPPTVDGKAIDFAKDMTDNTKVNSSKTVVFTHEPTVNGNTITFAGEEVTLPAYYRITVVKEGDVWNLTLALDEEAVRPQVDGKAAEPFKVESGTVTIAIDDPIDGLYYGVETTTALGSVANWDKQTPKRGAEIEAESLTATCPANAAAAFFQLYVTDVPPPQ